MINPINTAASVVAMNSVRREKQREYGSHGKVAIVAQTIIRIHVGKKIVRIQEPSEF